jgi:DNA-binding transcriptional regulator PaaX
MDYNRLKMAVLDLFTISAPMDSNVVAQRLVQEKRIAVSINALRMALLRYHKQGLLEREWREGEYLYNLTTKGAARLEWLSSREHQIVSAN